MQCLDISCIMDVYMYIIFSQKRKQKVIFDLFLKIEKQDQIHFLPDQKLFYDQLTFTLPQLRFERHPCVHIVFLGMWGEKNHTRQRYKLLPA